VRSRASTSPKELSGDGGGGEAWLHRRWHEVGRRWREAEGATGEAAVEKGKRERNPRNE
jgi:hypothetical protein